MACRSTRNEKSSFRQAEKVKAKAAEQAAGFFISATRDPHNPRYCGVCLLGAFGMATPVEGPAQCFFGETKAQASTIAHPELWKAVMMFLAHERTDAAMNRLLVRLSVCKCRVDQQGGQVKEYHEAGKRYGDIFLARMAYMDELSISGLGGEARKRRLASIFGGSALVFTLFVTLSSAIERSSVKSIAKGTSKSWPFYPTDLIPNGPDSLVQTLLQWYCCISDPVIFATTGFILRICQEILSPSLIKFKFWSTFVEAARRLVDLTMIDLSAADDDAHSYAAQRFTCFIPHWMPLFNVLYEVIAPDIEAEFWRGCETKAMQICSILLYLSSDPHLRLHGVDSWVDDHLAVHAQRLFRLFQMHLYPHPDMPVHPKIEEEDSKDFPPPISLETPRHISAAAILHFRLDTRCSARGCLNTMQNSGRNFQRCARCTVVAYCGRSCQVKAWKDEQYPHKRICPLFTTLVEVGGGPQEVFRVQGGRDHLENILHRWDASGVEEEEFQLLADCSKSVMGAKWCPLPDGTEWTPGYEDYNEIISQLSAEGRGPQRTCSFDAFLRVFVFLPSLYS